MLRTKTELHEKYNFIKFNEILIRIRDSFLTDIEVVGLLAEIRLTSRFQRKILKHCVLEEILKCYVDVETNKTNAILIETKNLKVESGGLFDEVAFFNTILSILDSCKRKIPILIKKYSNDMDFNTFLDTGEGKQFLIEIDGDKEKLRKSVCSFKDFKMFAKTNQLKYIVENVLDDIKFKKLFVS
jgi:hypothetical protein